MVECLANYLTVFLQQRNSRKISEADISLSKIIITIAPLNYIEVPFHSCWLKRSVSILDEFQNLCPHYAL